MSEKSKPSVSKLLRVLVAGGVAIAGAHGPRADEKPSPPAANSGDEKGSQEGAQKPAGGENGSDKASDKSKADAKKKADEKKKAEEEKKKTDEPEGGGVKGW